MARLLIGLSVLASGLLLRPGELKGQEGRPEVARRQFDGNERFSDDVLGTAILTRQTECRSLFLQPFCILGISWAQDPSYLNRQVLPPDLVRIKLFYFQRGYRQAQVDTAVVTRSDGKVEVRFLITEGPPVLVESLGVLGLENVPQADEVVSDLPIEPGDPLSLLSLDATRDTLLARLRNRGYAHAEVFRSYFIPAENRQAAEVGFETYAGPRARFGPITFVGNEQVTDGVARRMLPFREGQVYSKERVFQGQRNLFNLEIIRNADIRDDLEHQPDTIVPVSVRINEGDAHRLRAGGGFTTAECLLAEASWASRNFRGGARRLQIQARLSNLLNEGLNEPFCPQAGSGTYGRVNYLLAVDFSQPWIFSPRNSATVGIFTERQSLENIFVRQAWGLNLAMTRSLGNASPLTVSHRPQRSSLEAAEAFFCTNYLVCEPEDIQALQAPNWLSPAGISFSQDRTDRLLNPARGYRLLVDLEHAASWTGSDFGYERIIGETTWFRSLSPGVVLATRVRAGWLRPRPFEGLGGEGDVEVVHPSKRFYAGGANSVRGFAQNDLGPRSLAVPVEDLVVADAQEDSVAPAACQPEEILDLSCDAGGLSDNRFTARPSGGNAVLEGNVEFRFRMWSDLAQGSAFLDFGQVWTDSKSFESTAFEFTPGFGFRYFTPFGPVRLDVAYRFRGGEYLPVITDQLRVAGPDDEVLVTGADGTPYARSEELAVLGPSVYYGDVAALSIERLQIHLSIGQAF